MVLALEGIKLLDLSRLAPGPYCSMLLGDMGAEVLLIEEAGTPSGRRAGNRPPDARRGDTSAAGRRAAAFNALGRNKRSIRLNLKTEEARQIFHRLSDAADVVLEGFRPGVVRRLGVDYETLSRRNPRLIYCSLSGYGQDGPYAQLVGHDINYISMAGALGTIGREGAPPAIPDNIIADFAGGGLMSAFAICVAIIGRGRTGRGQYVDSAMSDGVLSLITSMASSHFANGDSWAPATNRVNGGVPQYNVYETQDGKWISVGALEPWFYANLCTVLGREDFVEHQDTTDEAKRREIFEHFRSAFKSKTRAEWFTILSEVDICAAPVYTLAEAFQDPHNRHRRMVIELEVPDVGTVQQVGIAPKLSETPGRVREIAPWPGQHTDEVLASLGYDAATIAEYRGKEIVG